MSRTEGIIMRIREKHLPDRQMTLILAFIIGILASFAGYVLHWIIQLIQQLLTEGFNSFSPNWLYLVFPIIGIYITYLIVKYIVKDNISHGITRVLLAFSTKQARLKPHNCWTSVITSAITIGFGGSVGAEAPIVLTGSAIGSNLGQMFHLDKKSLMLLVGCGASAAIAGIFKAPIAGLVFTLEVLMVDLSMTSLLPILIASVTATVFSYILLGEASLFSFHLDSAWNIERIPASILLGIACGMLSLYFIRSMSFCESIFKKLKNHTYAKLFIGGSVLSLLIFLFPALYGEGYSSLNIFLNGNTVADWNAILNNSLFYGHGHLLELYIVLVILTKTFATTATNGSGGVGGTFAPSLFVGGFAGFLFAYVWNKYQIGVYVPEKNFTLLGMAGVLAGVMHAPLTGMFLIAEITGGYDLFMPLIMVCIVSTLTISIFETNSIYAMRLDREGKLLTHHIDRSVLTLMSLESMIEKDFSPINPELPLGKLVNEISRSNTSFLPVVNQAGILLGEIDITKIRHIMFRTELYNRFKVNQIMTPVETVLGVNDSMKEVMKKFDSHNANYLPVVDVGNRLIGYVSRTRLYSMYRKMVKDLSTE